jgi:hypothetical protein
MEGLPTRSSLEVVSCLRVAFLFCCSTVQNCKHIVVDRHRVRFGLREFKIDGFSSPVVASSWPMNERTKTFSMAKTKSNHCQGLTGL